jgi:hypothetical protein
LPPVLRATWGGPAPRWGRPWSTSSGESRHERQYRGDEGPWWVEVPPTTRCQDAGSRREG